MGWKTQLVLFVVVLQASYVLYAMIKFGQFTVVHNHLPGNCTRFEMPGSEDMALYPNHHVLISSGAFSYPDLDPNNKPLARIFLLDLNLDHPEPVPLPLENFSVQTHNLVPHGMAGWVSEDGKYLLYFVNHRKDGDTVESFEYRPSKPSLVYRKTFRDSEFRNLNDLVVVAEDKFYVSVDRYYTNKIMKTLETFGLLPWPVAPILYCNNGTVIVASEGMRYPNGVEKSRDGKFIFVNALGEFKIKAFTRQEDNTLKLLQELPIQPGNDNLFVDPETGHLWVAILVNGLSVISYDHNTSIPIKSKILHIKLDPSSSLPFDNTAIEEVFSSSAEDGMVGAVSVGVYACNRLVVGTIWRDMMLCDVHYLRYT